MKEKNKKKKIVAAIFAALLSTQAVRLHTGMHEREFIVLILAIGAYFLFKTVLSLNDGRIKKISLIIGGFFSLSYLFNDLFSFYGDPYFVYVLIVCLIGMWLLFSAVLELVYTYLKNSELKTNSQDDITLRGKVFTFFGSFFVIYAWFIFWLMLMFPGNMSYDSFYQLSQAIGLIPLNNNHPVLHTLLIRFCYNTGLKLFDGNQNNAIAFYCAIQALLMAGCFAFFFETLYACGLKAKHILLAMASFFIIAYHGIYSATIWKDVLFSGWTLLLSCTLWRIIFFQAKKPEKMPMFEIILFFIAASLFCLFRKNGYYAFLACIPFLFIAFLKRTPIIPIISVVIAILVYVINGPIIARMGLSSSDTIEFFAVPLQHIACAVKEGAELSDEEYALLAEIVDVSDMALQYEAGNTDGLKALVREKDNLQYLSDNLKAYFKLWVNIGCRYPTSYFKAQIDLTKGYYYPDGTTWFLYLENTVPSEYKNSFRICWDSKFSDSFYNCIQNLWIILYKFPVFAFTSSIGACLFFSVAAFGMCVSKTKKHTLIVFSPVLAIMMTLMIAPPIDAHFRYAYPMFTTLPLLCIIPFIPFFNDDLKENQ